jgi:tetratricopeptide (TPR) repeat protein
LSNYDRAQELLQEILELNPQNLDALYAISWLSRAAFGDGDAAMEYIDRCVQIDPQNRACLSYKGTLQDLAGDIQGAVQTYQQLIRAGTTNPAHFLAAGQAYITAGQCSSAVTALQQGYELEQESDAPDADRLATFETLMLQCGADISPVYSGEATPEATAESETAGEGQ